MSEMSDDLKRQIAAGMDPTLKRFLEQKPGYDGPTLSDEEQERLRREEQVKNRERFLALESRLHAPAKLGGEPK
jgi:hypothetical protein